MSFMLNKYKLTDIRCALNSFSLVRHLLSNRSSCIRSRHNSNTTTSEQQSQMYDRDPQTLFTDPETQKLLESMTQLHIHKVFRKSAVSDNSVEYKFMTNEQLEEEFSKTMEKAKKLLKMPPVVQIKEDKPKIISNDKALNGYSDTKYVFTDVTFGIKQSERKVVVRQIDGTLEYATLDLAKRMKQLYFPLEGRKIQTPRMFQDEEHLTRCLNEQKYEFILDRLILQFEPYEPDYHRICNCVYQHINETKEFDQLRSTRHFGPMAFYYAWNRCIDDLLYDMIQRDYLVNSAELIALMYKINDINCNNKQLLERLDKFRSSSDPAMTELRKSIRTNKGDKQSELHHEIESVIGKTYEDFEIDDFCLNFIDDYIRKHALKKVQLELALQTLKEINLEKKQLYEGLNKAHGIKN